MSEQAAVATGRPVVLKFGGSSVADLAKIRGVAAQVALRAKSGPVAVVVSAMGKTTNNLLDMARALEPMPSLRELDALMACGEQQSAALLAIAITAAGQPAMALTGWQAGLTTDEHFGDARLTRIDPQRVHDVWQAGMVAVITGFQGLNPRGDIATLGRGGSDTSAVVLAGALAADCEIYSDVDGIYSADPRIVALAQHLPTIDPTVTLAMARAGAKVLHARALEYACELGVEFACRATEGSTRQTVVARAVSQVVRVQGVATDASVAWIDVVFTESLPIAAMPVLIEGIAGLGLRGLQIHLRGFNGVLSLTQRDDACVVQSRIGEMLDRLREHFAVEVAHAQLRSDLAQVSCVGPGLDGDPTVVTRAAGALAGAGLDVVGTFTDPYTLAFLVTADHGARATEVLHDALVAIHHSHHS